MPLRRMPAAYVGIQTPNPGYIPTQPNPIPTLLRYLVAALAVIQNAGTDPRFRVEWFLVIAAVLQAGGLLSFIPILRRSVHEGEKCRFVAPLASSPWLVGRSAIMARAHGLEGSAPARALHPQHQLFCTSSAGSLALTTANLVPVRVVCCRAILEICFGRTER